MSSALSQESKHQMIRVNHAGELGAVRIYQGQLAVLGETKINLTLEHMLQQEKEHEKLFSKLIKKNHVRPSVLNGLWHHAAYALGYGSALLGEKAAMACTVAIEEVIEAHYKKQLEVLETSQCEKDLKNLVEKCYAEEVEHRSIGLEHEADQMKHYPLFSRAVKTASSIAIWLSKRL